MKGCASTTRTVLTAPSRTLTGYEHEGLKFSYVLCDFSLLFIFFTALLCLPRSLSARQAVGRVLRYPQHRPCTVYRMYAQGTVEEELYAVWGWV